ncbi:MAG: sigma 54-interacting transcriptional regulator [Planctomycetota bacterium]|jgi:Nif-specific regulatory protein
MPLLRITDPSKRKYMIALTEDPLVIGKGSDCDVSLADPRMDVRHCQIEPDSEGQFKIVDLETKSGVEVNGAKVNVQILKDGDKIRIGDTIVVFEESEEPPEAEGEQSKTERIRLRRRRGRLTRRRRAAPEPAEEEEQRLFSVEDLRVVLESLIEESGSDALDEARKELDRVYEDQKGAPLYKALSEERDSLYRMLEINKLVNSEHSLKGVLEIIMDAVVEMSQAERGFLILMEKKDLVIKVARNFDREAVRRPEFKVSHTICEEVIRKGQPILSADALNDLSLPAAGSVTDLKLRSLLCLPFRIKDKVLGCVYIDNRFQKGIFKQGDLPFLQGFADQAAIAIENARLYEQIQQRQNELRNAKEEVDRLNIQLQDKVEKQYAELSKVKEDLYQTRQPDFKYDYSNIVGRSRAIREVLALVDKVIESDEPAFIHGQSGTGKELIARAIHFNSKRAKTGQFVSQNCSAIPDSLLESELFGHEKGAFTGAHATKKGLFEHAHRGTLFLDEIGDMPMEMQKLLLRAIQEGEIRHVGGKDILKVSVRIVSASNKDLAELIQEGSFREDLFYRLNVVKITLPRLRDRKEDIPLLVEHFLEKIHKESEQPKKSVDEEAYRYLVSYSWPGNIRELENEIRRAVALSGDTIHTEHFKEEIRTGNLFEDGVFHPLGTPLKVIVKEAVEEVEKKVILEVLRECGWRKSEAARMLGVSRPTLDSRIEAYGLQKDPSM